VPLGLWQSEQLPLRIVLEQDDNRVTPLQPASPKRRHHGGTSGGNYCSLNKNHLIAQLLSRDFESNPGSQLNQGVRVII
jgi:hypothetical protein